QSIQSLQSLQPLHQPQHHQQLLQLTVNNNDNVNNPKFFLQNLNDINLIINSYHGYNYPISTNLNLFSSPVNTINIPNRNSINISNINTNVNCLPNFTLQQALMHQHYLQAQQL